MSYETFELTVEDGLARLNLNQPDLGNPFNETACREFVDVASDLGARKHVRAVLLSGRGRFFSVGGDLSMFSDDPDAIAETVLRQTAQLHMGMARLMRLDAPIVACVHGAAMGGAMSVVANCDLVYAGRSAKIGAAYAHIGFTCDLGATFGLASRMGIARARRFLLLGETLGAEAAQRTGLVDEIFDDKDVVAQAEQMALKLSRGPTRAYGAVRRLMARSLATPFESQLEDEAQALAHVAALHDAREGIMAFTNKRKPNFTGQ